MKTIQICLFALAVGSFVGVTGCSGSPDPAQDETSAEAVSSAYTYYTSPACINRYASIPQDSLAQTVHIHNGCYDKNHPAGYDVRIRIVYGVLGQRQNGGCFLVGAGASQDVGMKAWENFWEVESCRS